MERIIFIPVETKNRELDGRLLLITYFLEKGFDVIIGSRAGIKREIQCYKEVVYLAKSLSRGDVEFYVKLRESGSCIGLLEAEGGIYYKNSDESILSAFSPDILHYVKSSFVYGEKILQSIDALLKRNDIRIIVSGEPRFDLLKPKFINFFSAEIADYKSRFKDFILVNTNFGSGNSIVGNEILYHYIANDTTMTKGAKELLFRVIELQKKIVPLYIDAIKNLATDFPKLNFIVRPHPSESIELYKMAFSTFHNISTIKEGNVAPWILASHGVIHYDCTTGVEAHIAKRPVISFVPLKDDELLAWLPVQISKVCEDYISLRDTVSSIVEQNYNLNLSDEIKELLEGYVFNVNNESSEIIVEEISNWPVKSKFKIGKVTFVVFMNRYRFWIKNWINRLSGRQNNAVLKFGNWSKKEIAIKLERLYNLRQLQIKLKIKRLGHDVFKISGATHFDK
jgi:surface carbohydrate biosynthesis protein